MSEEHHLGEDLAAMAGGGRGLEAAKKAELERHVDGCAACRAALVSARMVLETVDAARPPAPSEGFDRALFARLDALDRIERPGLLEQLRAWFSVPRMAAVAAVAAGITVGVITLRGPSEDLDQAEVARELEGLAVADDLELYRDLDVIEEMEIGEPG
jgi:hypothetical protein